MLTREDEEVLDTIPNGCIKQPQVLPHSVCSALEPGLALYPLAGCQHLHKAACCVAAHICVLQPGTQLSQP